MFEGSRNQGLGAPPVVVSAHDNGLVLWQTETGQIFAANRTGARIWQSFQSGLSAESIATEISRRHQIPQETAREHTKQFLTELQQRGLIALGGDV